MTNQEAIERVSEHLIKQGRRCVNRLNTCQYFMEAEDSTITKCAIGALIPPELYCPELESYSNPEAMIAHSKGLARHFDGVSHLLLSDLQGVHGFATKGEEATVDQFKNGLLRVARNYNLTAPACLLA